MGAMILTKRHHVNLFGYKLARGEVDGQDCIWYDTGKISFRSGYFETGPVVALIVGAGIVLIASILVCFGPIGLLIAAIVLLYGCGIWFKLFMV